MHTPEDINTSTDGNGGPLEAGQYIVEIIGCQEKVASSGKGYFNLKMRVIDGNHEGCILWDKLFTSTSSMGRLKTSCNALGIKLDPGAELEATTFMGKKAIVTVVVEGYNGRDQNKVTFDGYQPYDDSTIPDGAAEELAF